MIDNISTIDRDSDEYQSPNITKAKTSLAADFCID